MGEGYARAEVRAGEEDGSRPAQGGPEEEGAMIKSAHIHEFIADEREDWPGFNCRVCGFHIHANAESHARNAGARFIEDDGTLPLDEIPAGTECWCGHRAHLHDRHGCMFRNYNQDGGEGCSCVGFGTRH